MAKSKKKLVLSMEEKLEALYNLQCVDSEIDKLRIVRGELPIEIQDLEDVVSGLNSRIDNIESTKEGLDNEIAERKDTIKNAKSLISKYSKQLDNIKNNREYTSLTKEVEYQELEKELNEKKIKEAKAKKTLQDDSIDLTNEELKEYKETLKLKKNELSEITAETEKEENLLIKSSNKCQKKIDERLLYSYNKIRSRVKNGLAVVSVNRDACGGCFSKIPSQRQLDIKLHKKIIVCEHCGRILIDANILSDK